MIKIKGLLSVQNLQSIVHQIYNERFPTADHILLAGSLVRGEASPTSDLDLVVIYQSMPNAYRASFTYDGWPVEAFVHDPETLEYFFETIDRPSGVPSLMAMVFEGIEVPGVTALSQIIKQRAKKVLDRGPIAWTKNDLDASRYMITDLAEDLKGAVERDEIYAVAGQLYQALGNHYFRSKALWSAKGKSIPRRLKTIDPSFANQWSIAFHRLYQLQDERNLLSLIESLLSPVGGTLFDGYSLNAPKSWRQKPQSLNNKKEVS